MSLYICGSLFASFIFSNHFAFLRYDFLWLYILLQNDFNSSLVEVSFTFIVSYLSFTFKFFAYFCLYLQIQAKICILLAQVFKFLCNKKFD